MIIYENLYKREEDKMYVVWQNFEIAPKIGSHRLIKMKDKTLFGEVCSGFSIMGEPNWNRITHDNTINKCFDFFMIELFAKFESCVEIDKCLV